MAERRIFNVLIHSPHVHHQKGYSKSKPRVWNSIRISSKANKDPSTLAITCCLSGYTLTELQLKPSQFVCDVSISSHSFSAVPNAQLPIKSFLSMYKIQKSVQFHLFYPIYPWEVQWKRKLLFPWSIKALMETHRRSRTTQNLREMLWCGAALMLVRTNSEVEAPNAQTASELFNMHQLSLAGKSTAISSSLSYPWLFIEATYFSNLCLNKRAYVFYSFQLNLTHHQYSLCSHSTWMCYLSLCLIMWLCS